MSWLGGYVPIPIWPAEIGWSFKTCDGIDFGSCVVDHDVYCVCFFDSLS
jgi:hypothetical protein